MDSLKTTWKSSHFMLCHLLKNLIVLENICTKKQQEIFIGDEMGEFLNKNDYTDLTDYTV